MRLHRCLIFALVLLLVGCQALRPTPLVGPDRTGSGGPTFSVQADTSISGRVDFSPVRQTQASPAQVVDSATVSFIDMTTNATVVTGKTNAAGNFTLSLGSFTPVSGATYLLEAVKGLNAQAPGSSSARFRTILRWNGTAWLSCSNASAGGTILINALTTALAIETALDPGNVPAVLTIGKVNPATTPATLNGAPGPYTNHPDSEINQLATDLISYLGVDADPLASVPSIAPTISSFSPTSGVPNSLIRLQGSGFSVVPSGNTVTLGSTAAQVVLATPTSLVVVVPTGAVTGTLRVQTGRGSVTTAANFTVEAAGGGSGGGGSGGSADTLGISSFSPSSGRPGITVTLNGAFGAATPSVVFQAASASVAAVALSHSPTQMTVRVPVGAESGVITVGSGFSTASSLLRFTVLPGNLNTVVALSNSTAGYPYALPEDNTYMSSAASGSFYYLIGGQDNSPSKTYDTVRMFSLASDGALSSIKTVGKLLAPRYQHCSVALGNYLYVMGGNTGTAIEYARIYADGTLGPFQTWNAVLPGARTSAYAVAHGNTIYVLGGTLQTKTYFYFNVNPATGQCSSSGSADFAYATGTFNYTSYSTYEIAGNYVYMLGGGQVVNSGAAYTRISSFPITGPGVIGAGSLLATPITQASWPNTRSLLVGDQLYQFNQSGVYTATLNPGTGNIGTFKTVSSLPSELNYFGGLAAGNRLYLFGGTVSSNAVATILTTSIKTDDTLQPWATLGFTTINRLGYTGQVLGNKAWLIGGSTGAYSPAYNSAYGTAQATTEYFNVEENGSLGPSTVGPSMQAARLGATSFVANGYLYVIGGSTNGLEAVNSIERAQVNGDGTLGNFSTMPNVTSVPRMYAASAYIGGYIYLFGGTSSKHMNQSPVPNYASIERAEVRTDGSLGPFEMLRAQTLPGARSHMSAVVIGDYVYLIGGLTGNYYQAINTTIYARIDASGGGIGTFRAGPNLSTAVYLPAVTQIGSYLYCFGGANYSPSGAPYSQTLVDIQRAAINPDGTLQSWGSAGISLPNKTGYFTGSPHIVNNWVFLIGGSNHYETTNFDAGGFIQQSYIQ